VAEKEECEVCGYYGSSVYYRGVCPNDVGGREAHISARSAVLGFHPGADLKPVDADDIVRYVYEGVLPPRPSEVS
jgi:hypothetical protein